MGIFKAKDGDGVDKYFKVGDQAGTELDPFVPIQDVFIQDQATPPVDFFFTKAPGPPTALSASVAIDDYDITVDDATGCTTGGYFGVFNTAGDRAYFGEIVSVAGNTLTMDTPMDFAFQAGDTASCLERNLGVDGSVTPQIFSIKVGEGSRSSVDIARIMVSMLTATTPTLAKFGDLTKLTRGLVLRRVNGDIRNIWNVKDNGELANLTFDYDPYLATNPSQGQNGANFRNSFNGQDKHGVVIRLNPGDELQLIIQDDLSGLTRFRVIAEGHIVE
jgi:hypothetical protein